MDGQDLFVPAPTGQQGEQQAHCAPKSALPLSTRVVLLGLPRSCLTPSGLDELSECAGGMNRLLHVLLPWPGRVDPLAGQKAQGQGPWERTTPKRFSPGLSSRVRGLREQRARLLANRPLEAAGEVFPRERAVSAQRPHRPVAESNTAPAIGQPVPDLPGLQSFCPMKGQAARSVSRHAREPPQA